VSFNDIGGLSEYIDSLKEMVFFPLLYPDFFANYHITPPRGVLLCGPPGTGKTLIARALACAASKAGQKVSFYMRKGADVLSKWVGEAERQLKLLFEEAQKNQPSIIFFDEIDGLAPVRSSKQEQIHNSIVSTLLALMDGLDSRGQVVLIGATNRIDAIDGALRRPGRFDREFYFPLPGYEARAEILDIHTRRWKDAPPKELKMELAASCVGYCGADLKALCTEAAIRAFREKYPQVYTSDEKFVIDVDSVSVEKYHFLEAMSTITPAAHRGSIVHSRPLSSVVAPCLKRHLGKIMEQISDSFPFLSSIDVHKFSALYYGYGPSIPLVYRPRLLICGGESVGLVGLFLDTHI
jgi:ATPase family AAA domain-containing protein 2